MNSSLSDYFADHEFDCKCGKCGLGIDQMKPQLLLRLATAREIADCSFVLTSAMRCTAHNAAEGGRPTSSHLTGWAVDVRALSSRKRFKIIKALLQAGFERIGVAKTFIHADCDPRKPKGVTWLY